VPTISECDLPPRCHIWIPTNNEFGGTFMSKELVAAGISPDQHKEILDKAQENMIRALAKSLT